MQKKAYKDLVDEVQELRIQLEEAEETLNAIRRGEVDGLVVSTPKGEQIYTISGADKPYRTLIEEMKEGAVMLSSDNTVLYCNSGFAKMIKRPIDKIVGNCMQNIVFPTHLTAFKELLAQGRTGKGVKTKEITLRSSDNRPVQTLMTISPFREGSNETTFLVATNLTEHMEEDVKRYTDKLEIEITERKKAEEALRLSEERFSKAFNLSPFAVIMTRLSDGTYVDVNDTFLKMFEFSREEVIGHTANELKIYAKPDGRAAYLAAFKNGRVSDFEVDLKTKSGKHLKALGYAEIINVNGQDLTFGTLVDITERKKAEEALKESEKTFLELIERAPFGIYVINSQFRIAEMNKGSQNGAFINVRPIIGRDFSEAMHILWPEPTASEIISHFRHTLETGEPYYSPQFINPRHDVEIVESYEWEFQRIRLPDGQYGVICYYFDSTKLREAERGLSESQAKLKEYSTNLEKLVEERTRQLKDSERLAAIGATAGMVGHDIRNPLQAITSDVYLARTELSATSETEEKKNALESLGEIEKNIDYINKIVQDLQDYARPLNPKVEESDLRQIVESLFAKNGFPENVEVKIEVAEGTRKIGADAYYLNRILFNLVTNAVQAMSQGGKLTVRAYKEENDTVIMVSDTGVGIPKEIQEKMFTLMFTTKSKGQGFGLPVVKRMTESLGGTVSFKSEEGKGTTFFVRLPIKKT